MENKHINREKQKLEDNMGSQCYYLEKKNTAIQKRVTCRPQLC